MTTYKSFVAMLTFSLASTTVFAHPLKNAVQELAKASQELQSAQNGDLDALKIDSMRSQIATLWTEAMLLPLQKPDETLAKIGFIYKTSENPNDMSGTIEATDGVRDYRQSVEAGDLTELQKLDDAIQAELLALSDIKGLLDQPATAEGIAPANRQMVVAQFGRALAFRSLQNDNQTNRKCIQDVAATEFKLGLVPQISALGGLAWSVNDLQRIYGKMSFQEMNRDARAHALANMQDLSAKYLENHDACVSDAKLDFTDSQIEKLSK